MSEKQYKIPFRCSCCGDVTTIVSTAAEESQRDHLHVYCPNCFGVTDVAFLWNHKEVFKPGYHTANP